MKNDNDSKSNETTTTAQSAAPVATTPPEPVKTPEEWARELGKFKAGNPHIPQVGEHYSLDHAAADRLYGWSEHAFNHQKAEEAFKLTRKDYESALQAALRFPCVAPHEAAVTPAKKPIFENFQPAPSRR